MPQLSEDEEFELLSLERERAMSGASGAPQIGEPPSIEDLRSQHAANQAEEATLYNRAQSGTSRDAAIYRGIGGVLPFGLGGAMDVGAQMIEKAGGQRQSYNPARTAVEAGIGMIPGGSIAKSLKGIVPAGKGLVRGVVGQSAKMAAKEGAKGAAMGAGAVAATDLSEGKVPTKDDLITGAQFGGMGRVALSAAPGIRQLHKVTQAERAPGKIAGNVARALRLPKHIEGGARDVRASTPDVFEHAASTGRNIETVDDVRDVSEEALSAFAQQHLEPIKKEFGGYLMNARTVINRMDAKVASIVKEAHPEVVNELQRDIDMLSKPRKASELLEYYHDLQAELQPFKNAKPEVRADKYKSASWRFKVEEEKALRDVLANHYDRQRARLEGTTVGALKEAGEDFKSIHQRYGALRFMRDFSKEASEQLANERLVEEGRRMGLTEEAAETALSPLFISTRRILGKSYEWLAGGANDPDELVKHAFQQYQKFGKRPTQPRSLNARGKFNVDAENLTQQKALPAMGETGEPSLGDMAHRLPEDWQAAKSARQRTEGQRTLTGQTRSERIAQSRSPVQGNTIEVAPVPSPSLGSQPPLPTVKGQQLQPYSGLERRLSEPRSQGSRATDINPEVAQRAIEIKDALDNISPEDIRKGVSTSLFNELDALNDQHPWIADFLMNRNVRKGGQRQ